MAATSQTGEGETVGLPAVGQEGDTCEQCGSALATDQRYCLNCGWRRGEARVDYERRLNGGVQPSANGVATVQAPVTQQQWTPAFAILAIALLGVMLLLGVLIGKKGNNGTQTVAAQAAPTTTAATAAPTGPTATTASNKKGAGAAGSAGGNSGAAQGGSGSTNGIQAADTHASTLQNAKNGPDVVATQGAPPATDTKAPGGGSGSGTCIGSC